MTQDNNMSKDKCIEYLEVLLAEIALLEVLLDRKNEEINLLNYKLSLFGVDKLDSVFDIVHKKGTVCYG